MVRVTTPDPTTTPEPTTPVTPVPAAGPAQAQAPARDVDGIRPRLTFFKVMAFIVGIGLLVLVAEMVLSYGFDKKGDQNPLAWWPQPHGFVYMVYLVATALLGFRVNWPLTKIVLVMLAGCVPFLSFWVEHRVSREVEAGLAAARQ
jgi:integral membrane protein